MSEAAPARDVAGEAKAAHQPAEVYRVWGGWKRNPAGDGLRPLTVALCGTFTTNPLEPYLGVRLLEHGIAPRIRHSPYNQVHAELLSPDSTLRTPEPPEVVVVLWRIEELLSGPLALLDRDPSGAREAALQELETLRNAAQNFAEATGATVLLSNPPCPTLRPLGLLDARLEQGLAAFHADVLSEWRRLLAEQPRLHLLDVDGLQREFGAAAAENPKMWLLGKMPWTEGFCHAVSRRIARTARALLFPPRKVLALDGDNTLWGGIVGEDGPLNVQLGEDAPGNAYAAVQQYARALRTQGVLLALVSKNNPEDVDELFSRHPGMLLKRDELAALRVNWEPKSASLRAVAQELGLGLDSLVFVDDNASEIAEVQANAPEVLTIHLSGDPSRYVHLIDHACAFDRLSLTTEDRQRAGMYADEQRRVEARGTAATMEQYLAGLGLIVRITRAAEADLPRLAQLVNKTNQFNVTTVRRTEAEVRALWEDPRWHLYSVRVADRFGDYGLTGLAFCRDAGDEWEIDTLLLSCRVLGRGVETALAAVLLEDAAFAGKQAVRGRFVPTAKNAPAAQFFQQHGFEDAGDGYFARASAAPIAVPGHLTLERDNQPAGTATEQPARKREAPYAAVAGGVSP